MFNKKQTKLHLLSLPILTSMYIYEWVIGFRQFINILNKTQFNIEEHLLIKKWCFLIWKLLFKEKNNGLILINVDISMKAISNVFIKTADTLLVFIICYFKILYKSDNSIWIIAIKIAHLKKKRFLLTLHYPIRNWFSEIRKINSVITALKFQRPNFTCTGRNCIYVIMKGYTFC